ncbi:MAG: NAD(P)/FAD-dependent oxidoreductase [Flavobacteriales bacterium]
MNRKDFLVKSTLGVSSLFVLPYFLQSCKRENLYEDSNFKGSVGIVGGGISGLYAALMLKQAGVNVKVFEASNNIGGRIKSLSGFSDFNVPLGAFQTFGRNSVWCDLLNANGASFVATDLQQNYFFNQNLISKSELQNQASYSILEEITDGLENYSGSDIPCSSYAQVAGLPNDFLTIHNALTGNSNGTDATQIGTEGLKFVRQHWQAGDDVLTISNTDLQSLLEVAFGSLTNDISLNTRISTISYGGAKVVLSDSDGNTSEFDKVIVTAPLGVLKAQLINFNPDLPPQHIQAINAIGFDKGIRVALKFNERFWPDNVSEFVGGTVAPQYFAPGAGGVSLTNNVLVADINGSYADQFEALGADGIAAILSELDAMFNSDIPSTTFVSSHIENWGDNDLFGGVKSFYPPQLSEEVRTILSTSVLNKVFFAGEATHFSGHHGTIHGAMESSIRAIQKIFENA